MSKKIVAYRFLSLVGAVIALQVAGPGLAAQGAVPISQATVSENVQTTTGPSHGASTLIGRAGAIRPMDGWGMEPPPDGYAYNGTFWGKNGSGTNNCILSGSDMVAEGVVRDYYCRQMTQDQADQWID